MIVVWAKPHALKRFTVENPATLALINLTPTLFVKRRSPSCII
jgi:hypothetical protein